MKKYVSLICACMALSAYAKQPGVLSNSKYYQLFGPLTFYHSAIHQQLGINSSDEEDIVDKNVSDALMHVYLNRPDLVLNTEKDMQESGVLREDIDKPIQQQVAIINEAEPLPEALPMAEPVELSVEKPKFWKYKGDGYLQFMQNYVSDNWYKGGESNYAAVGAVTLEANFDNKSKWKWDNKLEMKLGFQTSPSDTVNKFKTNEDLIRLTSKVGLQAANKWYYTLQLLAYTQFYRGLKANKDITFSDFMSPFNLNAGIGMDYKIDWMNHRITGTVNLSPIAVNYRYVDRADLAKSFGVRIEDGHTHSLTDFGSQITASVEWKMNDVVTWKSRLYGFTSFHRAELEWENTFQLKVSKYITANLFLFPRFDDSNIEDEKLGYWQFKEYSSLGFSYSF